MGYRVQVVMSTLKYNSPKLANRAQLSSVLTEPLKGFHREIQAACSKEHIYGSVLNQLSCTKNRVGFLRASAIPVKVLPVTGEAWNM